MAFYQGADGALFGEPVRCRHQRAGAVAGLGRAGPSTGRAISQTVVIVARVPLSEDAWRPLADGEMLGVRAGCFVKAEASR